MSLCGHSIHRRSNLILAAALLGSQSAMADSASWNGTVSPSWSDVSNWAGPPAAVPGSATGESATFNANSGATYRVIDLGAGVTIKNISFSTSGGAYTIGSGSVGSQTLTFESPPSGNIINATTVTGFTPLLNANLSLGNAAGDETFTFSSNISSLNKSIDYAAGISTAQTGIKTISITGAGNSNIYGNITDGSGVLALSKLNGGNLSLSGVNTYSGATTVTAGTLSYRNTSAKSEFSTLTSVAGGTVGLGVGGAGYYSSADVDALFAGTLTGFEGMNAGSGVGIDTTAGNFTYSTSQSASRALVKLGDNTLTLTGTNTYTGVTTIAAGAISVASIADNLSTTTINIGSGSTAGTLIYTGTGETVTRVVRLGGNSGGGTITQSGASGLLKLTNNVTSTTAGNKTLTLNGSTAGTGEIAGVISNAPTTTYINVTKEGTGTWTLSRINTYGKGDGSANGITTINGGTLALGVNGTAGGALTASAVKVNSGGTFAVTPGVTTTANNSITTSGTTLTMNAGSAFTMADGSINTFDVSGAANLYAGTAGAAPTYRFNVDGVANTSDKMAISGAASASNSGGLVSITPTTALDVSDSFTIATAASGLDTSGLALANGGIASFGNTAYSLSLVNTATASTVTVTGSGVLAAYYTGDQGTTLNASSGANTNWSTDITGIVDSAVQPTGFTNVYFSAAGATNLTIASLGQNYTFNTLNFNNAAGAVTLNNGGSNTLTLNGGLNVDAAAPLSTVNIPLVIGGLQTWTNNGQLAVGGTVNNGGFPLTISGTGTTALSGAISGTGPLNVNPSPTDTGAVTLSGTNTYSGGITVQSGALTLQGNQTAANGDINVGPNMTANAALTIAAGASVALDSSKTFMVGTTGTTGLASVSATTTVEGSVSNPGSLRVGRLGILNLTSGATWAQAGDMTVEGNGNLTAQMNIGTGASLTYTGANTIKVQPPTGNFGFISRLTISGILTTSQGFEAVKNSSGGAKGEVLIDNGTLKLSATLPNLFLADGVGVIATRLALANTGTIDTNGFDAGIAQSVTGTGGLTKNSAGVLTLTGANTYIGNTTVNNGTLNLSAGAQLSFVTGDSSGTGNNLLSGAGTVILDGNFSINTSVTDASALSNGSWQIENAASLPGAYGASFIVVGWTDAGGDKWTKTVGSKDYTFDETTGTVTMVGPASDPYEVWIASFEPNALLSVPASKLPTADPDSDGLNNLLEFTLGGSPVVSSPSISPVATVDASNITLTFKRSDESESPVTTQTVQISTDLADWTTIPAITIGASDNLPAVTVAENGTAPDDITVVIPRSGSVKKFVRLNVVK